MQRCNLLIHQVIEDIATLSTNVCKDNSSANSLEEKADSGWNFVKNI